ncbi:MAG TPA: geranylgeranyl reductase family protein, partial [Gaiellaceae bacterium]|nr:geranylgeranyl reductase family protein [Gaiellaceae bacterium]
MTRVEVAVVGAGPAGAVAAYTLASHGASVVLLDRARFPRDKPCGGGLTGRAVRLLPFSVEPVVEDRVHRIDFRLGYGSSFHRRAADALVLMTQRRRLDAFLVERAAFAGAEFRDGVKASRVERNGAGAVVRTDSGDVHADLVIGADGANGVSAAAVGKPVDRAYCVALEGNVPHETTGRDRYRGRAVLELGVVPGGYAWIFPKGDHVNVGVAGWADEGPRLRRHLERLLEAHGLPADAVRDLRGHRLPLRGVRAPLANHRVLLAGDAAGLVDPLSGDGIYEAVLSAREAAAAACRFLDGSADSLDKYRDALIARTGPLAAASWEWKHAFDRFPRLSFAITRLPIAWPVIQALLRGDLVDPSASRGVSAVPILLLAALGRA